MTGATYISGVLQVKAYRVLQYNVAKEVKKFGLNPTQWFILGYIKEGKRVRAADVATLLRVEPPLITSLTDDLDRKGMIDKVPDTVDKRVKLLTLTPKGLELVPKIETSLQRSLQELLDGVDANDLKAYQKVLQTIVSNGNSVL